MREKTRDAVQKAHFEPAFDAAGETGALAHMEYSTVLELSWAIPPSRTAEGGLAVLAGR